MFSNLLLLFCLINYSGMDTKSVSGKKGGKATLTCKLEDKKILQIDLSNQRENIDVCQTEECRGRVFQERSCDIIIKDLTFSDAGKYISHVYHSNDQTEVKRLILEYHLHIHDEISVKTGEELKMDVLWSNADKVEKNSSGEWTEVWTRGHGVRSDRLTDRDQTLTIKAFTSSDSGTYRVLDSEGEIWITVTVTESNTGLKEKLETDQDKTKAVESWIIVLSVIGALVLLGLIIFAVIWIYKHQHWNTEHQAVPMDDREQQNI